MELIARLAVIASCGSLMVAGLAVLAREALVRRPEPVEREGGLLALVNYVGILGFVVIGLGSALTLVGTVPTQLEPFGAAVRSLGLLGLASAGLLALWGLRSIGAQMSSKAEVRPDTILVTGGAFGLVRHPLYLSILLLWAGGALALLSPMMAVCGLVLVPPFVARSRVEERLLVRHFGDAYREYAGRVPMLVPGIRPRSGRPAADLAG